MLPVPADIFTEPGNVPPDGLANLGPLRRLAGVWQADRGVDINKAAGPERRVFREHIRMDAIDPQINGPQLFYGLRYHIHINTLRGADAQSAGGDPQSAVIRATQAANAAAAFPAPPLPEL
jgi:hypothetical protein